MRNIKIINNGIPSKVYFDDVDVSKFITSLKIDITGGELPKISAQLLGNVEFESEFKESNTLDVHLNYDKANC